MVHIGKITGLDAIWMGALMIYGREPSYPHPKYKIPGRVVKLLMNDSEIAEAIQNLKSDDTKNMMFVPEMVMGYEWASKKEHSEMLMKFDNKISG